MGREQSRKSYKMGWSQQGEKTKLKQKAKLELEEEIA